VGGDLVPVPLEPLGTPHPLGRSGSYAAYVLHPPVLVLASMITRPLPLPPEGKFVLVAPVGVVAAFALGTALTRLTSRG
jgi:peptidoglycan/LPS O-acetylase OafA/YrhL